MSAVGWLRRRLGWASPSLAMGEGVKEGLAEGLNPSPSTVPAERVEALLRAYDLAERLKKTEACAASRIEMQPCVIADVRWSGRELKRILDALVTREERRAVDDARWRRVAAALAEAMAKASP
jgi:hypothetical protein